MKRLITVLLPIIMSFTLVESYPQNINIKNFIHSGEKVKVVDKVINESDKYLNIDVKYPQLSGSENKEGEEVLNKRVEKWTIDWLDDIKLIVKEYFGDKLPPPNFPYEAKTIYEIKNNSNNLVSFYVEYYQYTGGAHGMTTRIPYNFNSRTGEILNLKDLFVPEYDYKTVINKQIKDEISKDKDKYFNGELGFEGIKENQNYYIEGNEVVILFGLYEIAPYVSGIIEFRIPINSFEDGFNYDKIK